MMAVKISRKRRKYVEERNPKTIKGSPLQYPVAIGIKYADEVAKLFKWVAKETEKEIKKIYSSPASIKYFAQDAGPSIASQSRIAMNKLIARVMKFVKKKAKWLAEKMVKKTDKASQQGLHASLKVLSGGLSIKTSTAASGPIRDAYLASIDANANLIVTMNATYVAQVSGMVDRSIQGGGGLETLIPQLHVMLDKKYQQHLNKSRNVALDQTRKAFNSLAAKRMESIGVNEYEWVHSSAGQKPREHHMRKFPEGLNTGIYKLSEPPIIDLDTGERGIPSTSINCKCIMRPIISFDEVDKRE